MTSSPHHPSNRRNNWGGGGVQQQQQNQNHHHQRSGDGGRKGGINQSSNYVNTQQQHQQHHLPHTNLSHHQHQQQHSLQQQQQHNSALLYYENDSHNIHHERRNFTGMQRLNPTRGSVAMVTPPTIPYYRQHQNHHNQQQQHHVDEFVSKHPNHYGTTTISNSYDHHPDFTSGYIQQQQPPPISTNMPFHTTIGSTGYGEYMNQQEHYPPLVVQENPYVVDPYSHLAMTIGASPPSVLFSQQQQQQQQEELITPPPPLHYVPDDNEYMTTYNGGEPLGIVSPMIVPSDPSSSHEYCNQLIPNNMEVEPGYYYPISSLRPETILDTPITSIAFDDTYSAIYLATVSKPSSSSQTLSDSNNNTIGPSLSRRGSHQQQQYRNGRSAWMTIHDTTSGIMYSSVQCHPEASPSTLRTVYEDIYGFHVGASSGAGDSSSYQHHQQQHGGKVPLSTQRVPNHAYKPPYGDTDPDHHTNIMVSPIHDGSNDPLYGGGGGIYSSKKSTYQMGINTLIPATGGHVVSISPAGVRVHTKGGLQIADYEVDGMICGTIHPFSNNGTISPSNGGGVSGIGMMSHVTVGGIVAPPSTDGSARHGTQHHQASCHVQCLDVWQGLRPVATSFLNRGYSGGGGNQSSLQSNGNRLAVTALGTSYTRGCVLAGCSDGFVRLLDGRGLRDIGKMKSHSGGVINIAISNDGTLIATTGYGSTVSPERRIRNNTFGSGGLYAYPDTSILLYDIRCMGRGGVPHSFAGLHGGPRFVSFIPKTTGNHNFNSSFEDQQHNSNRLLVGSGQSGGGVQIIIPFEEESAISKHNFIVPPLDRGESLCSMCVADENLALGTSHGKILQYKLAGYNPEMQALGSNVVTADQSSSLFVPSINCRTDSGESSVSTLSRGGLSTRSFLSEKKPLIMPNLIPPLPPTSIDGSILLSNNDRSVRCGVDDKMKAIFSTYIFTANPTLSNLGDTREKAIRSFGPLAADPVVPQIHLEISADLMNKATQMVDFLQTIPSSSMKVDLFEDHRSYRGNSDKERGHNILVPNPNKLIYANKLFELAYKENLNRGKRYGRNTRRKDGQLSLDSVDFAVSTVEVPYRYRIKLRPSHMSASSFCHSDYNQSGICPGWDYPVTMPNAFVSPIIMLLYVLPDIRSTLLEAQFGRSSREMSLLAELGYLFHRIETLSKLALLFPSNTGGSGKSVMTKVSAWAPTNFLSVLTTMSEAEQLQILDGSPAAVAAPRRPEAFYRFLLYQLDKEIGNNSNSDTTTIFEKMIGAEFVSVNQFVSGTGPETKKVTKQFTVELSYTNFISEKVGETQSMPYFCEVLQSSLCRATKLGAWNQKSKSYDTIVQRKIITSLPEVLSLSAECAGCKVEDGLFLWKTDRGDNGHWLPEIIEIELTESGSVIVRQLDIDVASGTETWKECINKENMPDSIEVIVKELSNSRSPQKRRYRLDAVVSMVRDDLDRNCPDEIRWGGGDVPYGHHVLHVRANKDVQKEIFQKQLNELEKYLTSQINSEMLSMTILGRNVSKDILEQRRDYAKSRLNEIENEKEDSSRWILINGFVVTDTFCEDARAFHNEFKEPSLIVYRAVDSVAVVKKQRSSKDKKNTIGKVPVDVFRVASLNVGTQRQNHAQNFKASNLPGEGDLLAFDAEFVSVQEEESTLTVSGTKVVIRETRHALARISVIDARQKCVLFDDHVQPNEPVSDYLTRFSGIVTEDLCPKRSRHNLITSRSAYLKLRCMIERGCIFVGHGLQQDFWTANLAVPPYQLIDTVDIYHKPAQRFVSLRFLTNFILQRDMQQDVHDSVEDAMAALELYNRAVVLMKEEEDKNNNNNKFETILDSLYEFGQKTDWKLGVGEEKN